MSVNFDNRIPALTAALHRNGERLVFNIAKGIENAAKASMPGRKSGRIYRRGAKTHQASAPGETPAIDLGFLVNSALTEQDGPFRARTGFTMEYAVWLEFGTRRMAPRPYLGPAFEKLKPAFEAGIKALLK